MKKSIVILGAATVLALGITLYGWIFTDSQIGEAALIEKKAIGAIEAADGLEVSFEAASQNNLHWTNSFDYSSGKSKSSFKLGNLSSEEESSMIEEIRFTGWSDTPYFICLDYGLLNGLQNKKIHSLYEEAALKVVQSGKEEKGKIRVKEYLDFYPVSFSFAFENKMIDSDNALIGLKIYEEKGELSQDKGTDYDEDISLYSVFNNVFKIPVIDNEYHEYKVLKDENYDERTDLPYKVEIEKSFDDGEDFYEFDPIVVLQKEDVKDGRKWIHPDIINVHDSGAVKDGSGGELALKNRILFAVNNRTAKGEIADVSQIRDGYGIYELPVDMSTTRIKYIGRRPVSVPNPCPMPGMLKMVYPLDTEAEYVEMSLSDDHRYLAVFFVKEGKYFADIVDADTWKSQGTFEMFPESEKLAYAWGRDGSLAATDHHDNIVIFERGEEADNPYKILYKGELGGNFDEAFFDSKMYIKENSYSVFKYNEDKGLSVAVKDGKAALVQNILAGSGENSIRTPALECAVIDESGLIYRGRLESSITDISYDISADEVKEIRDILENTAKGQTEIAKNMIKPVKTENKGYWKKEDK